MWRLRDKMGREVPVIRQVSERVSSTSSSAAAGGSCLAQGLLLGGSAASSSGLRRKPAPLLRARTLPAIVTPSLCIIQAQLDAGTQPPVAAMTQQHRQRHAKKKQPQGDSRRGSPDKSDASPPQSRLLTRRSPSGGALRTRGQDNSSSKLAPMGPKDAWTCVPLTRLVFDANKQVSWTTALQDNATRTTVDSPNLYHSH
ncbi:hypothetical protein MTO96_039157 [Rhipicephalus appendiculatus]